MNKLRSLIESGLVDREDGTIFDTRTNLLWQQTPSDRTCTWQEAIDYCKFLVLAGHTDWRLPTIKELKTLINMRHEPTIDPILNCELGWYWSSSTYTRYPNNAWLVFFSFGSVSTGHKPNTHYVRAVRC